MSENPLKAKIPKFERTVLSMPEVRKPEDRKQKAVAAASVTSGKVLIDGNARSNQATGGQDTMAERKRARTESSKPEGITREDYVKELTEEQVGARLQGHSRRRALPSVHGPAQRSWFRGVSGLGSGRACAVKIVLLVHGRSVGVGDRGAPCMRILSG